MSFLLIETFLNWSLFFLGAVAHACNSSTLGGQGGRITCGQEFKNSLVNMATPSLLNTYLKLARHSSTPVALAIQEAEMGGSLEPRS